MKQQNSSRKQKLDIASKSIIFAFSTIGIIALVLMFAFILKEAIPAYKEYGFFHMYFTSDFTKQGGYGIWCALLITLISSILSLLIAIPISIRAAIFIKYRMKTGQKSSKIFISILAAVPSVVFGIFAIKSLKSLTNLFIDTDSAFTLLNSIIMLSIMITPTLIIMILNQLDLVNKDMLDTTMALSNSKTSAIYKVIKKSIRQGIFVAAITALGRAIGETMALSMILTSPSSGLHGTVADISQAPFSTLGVEISRQMFQDGADKLTRSALFAAGIALFVVIMILIAIANEMSKKKMFSTKNNPINIYANKNAKIFDKVYKSILMPLSLLMFGFEFLVHKLVEFFQFTIFIITWPINWLIYYNLRKQTAFEKSHSEYYISHSKYATRKVSDSLRILIEVVCFSLIIGITMWLFIDVLATGLPKWKANDWKWSYSNGVGKQVAGEILNPLIWTFILVWATIIISLPFAMLTALYLSEYAQNKRSGKIIKFFLDSLGGTPSIMFGVFGVVFFLNTMGLQKQVGATSLIAGSLVMALVVLPTFTRSIEQVLIKIPNSLREASYALGASKFETIIKVIIPQSISGIATGIVLSAGRVIAETAPVYLTLGMFAGTSLGFMDAGHTLTTDILNNQVFSSLSTQEALIKSYKIASVALMLSTTIVLLTTLITTKNRNPIKPLTNFIKSKRNTYENHIYSK